MRGRYGGELGIAHQLATDSKGNVYVGETIGGDRVQKFKLDGSSLGTWGGPGREPGRLASPWALAIDSKGVVHVVDSENDRVQRIRF